MVHIGVFITLSTFKVCWERKNIKVKKNPLSLLFHKENISTPKCRKYR
jgi:hypothetical protein